MSYGHNTDDLDGDAHAVSRRGLIKHGVAIVGGGAAALLGRPPVLAQAPQNAAAVAAYESERQATSKTAGMKFRALVRFANTLATESLTLLPIHPLQVVVRTQAAQACYTTIGILDTSTPALRATVGGHGGVGIVEEVGTLVKRVKVGDQVIVASMPHCGTCGNCLDGRGSSCTQTNLPQIPAATMSDRTPVYMTAPGYAEYLVVGEDRIIPIFTRVPPVELSLFACTATTGLGLAMCRVEVEAGTDVAVFGLGPLGASAVQGARIQGARAIIGVDPIKYRRELALKVGATHVFDPNVDKGDDLVSKIRALSADPVPAGRRYTGERAAGPMYSLEAAGWTKMPLPAGIEAPPDLTGVDALQQVYAAARSGGYVRTAGVFEAPGATITFPAGTWGAGGKYHFGGNFAGAAPLRDIPRFIRLVEQGVFDAKSLVGKVYKPGEIKDALQASADRSAISAVIDFT